MPVDDHKNICVLFDEVVPDLLTVVDTTGRSVAVRIPFLFAAFCLPVVSRRVTIQIGMSQNKSLAVGEFLKYSF